MSEEKKIQKKGLTYPSSVKGQDYVEYQLNWVLRKKMKSKPTEYIEKQKKKYLNYISIIDNELNVRVQEQKKKEEAEAEAEKALLEQLMKKYNKV